MVDFTSALYLGLQHPSPVLQGWRMLSSGRPAVLEEPSGARQVAAAIARLQGTQAATLLPSTLHLFWDLLRLLDGTGRSALLVDSGAYPILHWAAEAARFGEVHTFPHLDAHALARLASRVAGSGRRPIVLSDGYCPGCNRPAPLAAYARISRLHGGWLVLDDTQALGVLGRRPSAECPLGSHGGGSLRWHELDSTRIIAGASLAKGFGAPLAVLSGPRALLGRFARHSLVRLHCSPPSVAVIAAARHALHCSAAFGDVLRRHLARLAMRLRRHLADAGLAAVGELPFPVQSVRAGRGREEVASLQRRLGDCGVRTLLTAGCGGATPQLTFIINARHRECDIDCVGEALARRCRLVA